MVVREPGKPEECSVPEWKEEGGISCPRYFCGTLRYEYSIMNIFNDLDKSSFIRVRRGEHDMSRLRRK